MIRLALFASKSEALPSKKWAGMKELFLCWQSDVFLRRPPPCWRWSTAWRGPEEGVADGQATLRASEHLVRSQPRHLRPDDRLSLSLGAAKAAFPGKIAGSKRDGEIYNHALVQIVAALREGRFADREVAGAGGSRSASRSNAKAETGSTLPPRLP